MSLLGQNPLFFLNDCVAGGDEPQDNEDEDDEDRGSDIWDDEIAALGLTSELVYAAACGKKAKESLLHLQYQVTSPYPILKDC